MNIFLSKTYKIFTLLIVITLSIFIIKVSADAQAYRGLIIDQYRFDVDDVNPGDTINLSFTVTYDFQPLNDGSYREVDLFLRSVDFTQGEDPGVPKFLEKDELSASSRLSDWIEFETDQIVLNQPNQKAEVNFKINVPDNAEPGGKYASVFVANKDGDSAVKDLYFENNPGVGINGELGPLIFMTVNGDIKKDLELVDVFTTNIKNKKSKFFFNPPVNVVVDFKNNGNVHLAPKGVVYIHQDDDYNNYLASFELNPTDNLILPGTSRAFKFTWDDSFITTKAKTDETNGGIKYSTNYNWDNISKTRIGNYKVTVLYSYTDINNELQQSRGSSSFIVFPWQIIVIILLIIFIFTLFFYIIKNKYSKNNGN